MRVLLFSPDPDLRAILLFLLGHYAIPVTLLDPAAVAVPRGRLKRGTVVLAELGAPAALGAAAPVLAQWAARCPCLVLTWSAELVHAQALIPQARAYLLVPVVPSMLVQQLRLLAEDAPEVSGYRVQRQPA